MELGDLQTLLEVGSGFCIAYLGLDRFRYSEQIQKLFADFDQKVKDISSKIEATEIQDTTITAINQLKKDVSNNNYGSLIFKTFLHCNSRKAKDQFWISIILVTEFICLVFASVTARLDTGMLCVLTLIVALLGISIPTVFIVAGRMSVATISGRIAESSSALEETHLAQIDSQTLKITKLKASRISPKPPKNPAKKSPSKK